MEKMNGIPVVVGSPSTLASSASDLGPQFPGGEMEGPGADALREW